MKYTTSITIERSPSDVFALMEDPANMPHWQDGFVSFTPTSPDPHAPGATADIVFMMGKKEVQMVETLVERDPPRLYTATYETDGVWNLNKNIFTETGPNQTEWRMEAEFRCSGFLRIMAFFMPGMFRKQSEKMMRDFKVLAEGEQA